MRLLPRKKSNNATREKIKEAAIDLLAEKGYASISTRDITKRADTALGQLTYYYKTKDSLITEIIDDIVETLLENLEEVINTSNDKAQDVKKFFDELIEDDEKNARIIVDLVSQALYNNSLTNRAANLLSELSKTISVAYENEQTSNAREKADELINSVLGKIVRKSIQSNYLQNVQDIYEVEKQEDESKYKKKRKSKKKLSMRAIFD